MDRNELTLAVAAALAGAVLLGWLLRSIFSAMNRDHGPRSLRRSADIAARLHAAEEAQAAAEARLREVEADLGQRLMELQEELGGVQAMLERERRASEEIRAAYRRSVATRQGPDGGGDATA